MASPDDAFAAGARELIKRSQALGISWRLATGTIVNAPLTQGSAARSSATVQSYVLMDGDTVAITVNNMTGTTLPVGTRVYVMMTPPSGNFIVGTVGLVATSAVAAADPRGVVAYQAQQADTASVGTGGAFITDLAVNFTAKNGRAYRATVSGRCITSGTTNVMGINLYCVTLATDVMEWGGFGPSGSTFAIPTNGTCTFARFNPDLAVTCQPFIAADSGTATWKGSLVYPRSLMIEDIGPLSAFPGIRGL